MESNILRKIQIALSKTKRVTMFRNNTGMGWAGKIINRSGNTITLQDPRPLHAGLCVGSSDLIGFTVVEITPQMVGQKIAVFTAIEGKVGRRKASDAQANFIAVVKAAGGFAGIANSEEAAMEIIESNP